MPEKPKRTRRANLTPEEREYRDFRTGYTYKEVSDMIWYSDEWHPAHHTRRRHSVLGKWRQIKREMFEYYQNMKARDKAVEVHHEPIPF